MKRAWIFLGLLVWVPARADWVTLQDGRHLRGIDLERVPLADGGDIYRFTLETGERIYLPTRDVFYVEKSPRGEEVEFRGEKVSLREKIETLREERAERDAAMVRRVEIWASCRKKGGGSEKGEKAREEISELPAAERARCLRLTLQRSRRSSARRFAAMQLADTELGEDPRRTVFSLARAAVKDDVRSVQKESLKALQKIGHEDTALFFLPALRSRSPRERARAAAALTVFPDRRAARELVATLHLSWSGFGRGYVMQTTQRAYVADYELVSGGVGFSVVEVADPIVRTATTGVVLGADVQKVEMRARLEALRKITGQDFGRDVERWRQWLDENLPE